MIWYIFPYIEIVYDPVPMNNLYWRPELVLVICESLCFIHPCFRTNFLLAARNIIAEPQRTSWAPAICWQCHTNFDHAQKTRIRSCHFFLFRPLLLFLCHFAVSLIICRLNVNCPGALSYLWVVNVCSNIGYVCLKVFLLWCPDGLFDDSSAYSYFSDQGAVMRLLWQWKVQA